jgi:hypothetical protein
MVFVYRYDGRLNAQLPGWASMPGIVPGTRDMKVMTARGDIKAVIHAWHGCLRHLDEPAAMSNTVQAGERTDRRALFCRVCSRDSAACGKSPGMASVDVATTPQPTRKSLELLQLFL